jgi:hypothetical protein
MKIQLLIAAATLGLALSAAAATDSNLGVRAYEVVLSDFRMPRDENGTIGFKECDQCEYITKRVSPSTDYKLDGHSVSLEKFRKGLHNVVDREHEVVTILHHLEADKVIAISVYFVRTGS